MDTEAALKAELLRLLDEPGAPAQWSYGLRDHFRLLDRNGVPNRLDHAADILHALAALRDPRVTPPRATIPVLAPADPLARIREQERARDARRRARLRGEDVPRLRPGTRRADQDREMLASCPAAAAS